VGALHGWDFSSTRTDRDPVLWDYEEVVLRYLRPTSRVLDIGTGGGEKFNRFVPHTGVSVAIDHSRKMIAAARETLQPFAHNTSLALMDSRALAFVDGWFDLVLDRHAGSDAGQVARVLRSGGIFITQQVGGRNMQAVFDAFDWGSNGAFWEAESRRRGETPAGVDYLIDGFQRAGCRILARAEYDVPWYIQDVESLIFCLKAPFFPESFDPDRHLVGTNRLLTQHSTPRGIRLNEHRELLIVAKP
jgi:SAM-dependent methyltransferase